MTELHVTHVAHDPTIHGDSLYRAYCIPCGWRGHWFATERDAQDEALLHLQGAS